MFNIKAGAGNKSIISPKYQLWLDQKKNPKQEF